MRSQFNTKASSGALWVFPPVVELRWGAGVCVLLDAYSCPFLFSLLQMARGAVEQQFLPSVQTCTYILFSEPVPDPRAHELHDATG